MKPASPSNGPEVRSRFEASGSALPRREWERGQARVRRRATIPPAMSDTAMAAIIEKG